MKISFAVITLLAVCVGAGSIVAALQQRPGEPTQARVWVQNREAHERIPVSVRDVGSDVTFRVQVTNSPPVQLTAGTTVSTRDAIQAIEYRAVLIPGGADPAAALRAAGAEGWDTTGLMFPAAGGTQVLLKRPRP